MIDDIYIVDNLHHLDATDNMFQMARTWSIGRLDNARSGRYIVASQGHTVFGRETNKKIVNSQNR